MGYVSENFSDFERQKQRGSTVTDYNTVDENDEVHRVMMEVEQLLEASEKRSWRSIMLTHDKFPCHCLLQTWWYPKCSNLVLIWDSGELLSVGLPDSSQPITIVIVGVMMAIRWLEAHVRENNRQEAPTREQLRKLDCLKHLDLFETMCKILNIPMEVKKIWARRRLMPWFRANMTAWLYEYAKKHMSKHGRVYSEYQLDIGSGAFKPASVTHRYAVTTNVKRISRTSERSGKEEEMLKEDLERNVTLCLHNSFCRNRESNVDKAEIRKAKIMIVANSEFVYTSKSLFWPDVIMLAAVDLDLLQSVSLAIGVQRQTDMNPITIVFAGINDHLHSRGFLSRLRDPTMAENAVWPAIKDILESLGEVVDATKEGSFTKVTPRVVFALSPGYAYLPDGLKFVYAIVTLLSEGKYDVIISAPNRMIEMENLRPLRAELPAVWSDISNAMRGFKDHALHMLDLDEVLGLELSNFSRQLKLKPGIDDDHRVVVAMSNDLWFRAMEMTSENTRRKNSQETRAQLEAMVLRTKPEANQWLHLSPREAALGADAFEQGPVMITKIHAHLLKEVNLAENAGGKTAELVNRMCQITLETFWTQEVKGQEGFEPTDSMLEGLGAGWTASFLAKVYPKVSHYLIKEFFQAVVEVSIVELLALFVTFGAESFAKGPAMLLTEGIQNLRLDGLLTLIAITHGNLGGLMKLTRCPEQMRERE